MRGWRKVFVLIAVVGLFGCATAYKPIPDGYTGPTASLADSGIKENFAKAQMFVVDAIDGKSIENSLGASRSASYGQGPMLTTLFITRQIQAKPQRVKLIGTDITAAPIVALFSMAAGQYSSVEGEVDFNPAPGACYIVKGELGKDGSSVWIEDSKTNERVTDKVEKK